MIISLFIKRKTKNAKMSPTEKFITKREPAKITLRNEKSNVSKNLKASLADGIDTYTLERKK